MIELAIPLLSAAASTLGSAVIGYRVQRRARSVKNAIKQRIKDRLDQKETLAGVRDVYAQAKAIYGSVTTDTDEAKVKEALDLLKKKFAKDVPPTV